jgi:protein-tyrosine phosphatase
MTEIYQRHLRFKSVTNFRDIGGYHTRQGRTVAWRRVFRSGEFARINPDEYRRLTEEIRLASVVDLRSDLEVKRQGIGLPADAGIKYYNISFIADGGNRQAEAERYKSFTNMGEFYIELARHKGYAQKIIKALEIIAEPKNHPLVFNCAIGKDRTGMLAAMLLSVLGVADADIIEDYSLSDQYMDALREQLKKADDVPDDVKLLPDFFWRAEPASMALLLSTIRQEYGSIKDYLEFMGCEPSLTERLEKALLVSV